MLRVTLAAFGAFLLLGFTSVARAGDEDLTLAKPLHLDAGGGDETGLFANSGKGYRGGRGLVTNSGMSGMFLNQTSGTLNQGQATLMYCLFINEYSFGSDRIIGHGLMFDYGVTDWLNVGVFGNLADVPGHRSWFDDPVAVAGPFVRLRVLKDHGWMPELSVGGIYLDGSATGDAIAKTEGFIAGSKLFDIDPEGTLRSLRVHLGTRYDCFTEAGGGNAAFVYGGLELELPYSLYLIGELQTNTLYESAFDDMAYGIGFQWKPNSVLGLSVAHVNPGGGLSDGFLSSTLGS